MCAVAMPIPDEALFDKGMTIGDAADLARRMTAVDLCARRNVSLGYCSDIARPSLLRDVYEIVIPEAVSREVLAKRNDAWHVTVYLLFPSNSFLLRFA